MSSSRDTHIIIDVDAIIDVIDVDASDVNDVDASEVIDVDAIIDVIDIDGPDPFQTWLNQSTAPSVIPPPSGMSLDIYQGSRLQIHTQLTRHEPADQSLSLIKIDQAARKSFAVQLLESTMCALCASTPWHPYITECGHSFCFTCLDRWFKHNHEVHVLSPLKCPLCTTQLYIHPIRNYQLRDQIDIYAQEMGAPVAPGPWQPLTCWDQYFT